MPLNNTTAATPQEFHAYNSSSLQPQLEMTKKHRGGAYWEPVLPSLQTG